MDLHPHATTCNATILFDLIYCDFQQTMFMLNSCSKILLCEVSCWQDLAINIRAVVDSCGRLRMGTVGVYEKMFFLIFPNVIFIFSKCKLNIRSSPPFFSGSKCKIYNRHASKIEENTRNLTFLRRGGLVRDVMSDFSYADLF